MSSATPSGENNKKTTNKNNQQEKTKSKQQKKAPPQKKEPKAFFRRDALVEIEKSVKKKWEDSKLHEVEASDDPKEEKFFVTFPYPYMNGKLHLGHAFSLTKSEFSARFQKLLGKRVLFPFGFHCTGMPIKACADKIAREIELYGNPPKLPPPEERKKIVKEDNPDETPEVVKFQWEIMESMGIDPKDIPKFKDPYYWLDYFPPIAKEDLKLFGIFSDFRRSFVTTEKNPYYDSFIRWQFNKLKNGNKISFGKRYSIYSPKDKQMCADHDRMEGEGVKPKLYTIVKLKVQEPFPDVLSSLKGKQVFLGAATLRPETMYGQTNCWLAPEGEYVAAEINENEILIVTERAARNLAFQGYSKEEHKVSVLHRFKGKELFGAKLSAPNAPYPTIYTLPLLTIDMKKTTGVVTSVPSDSPDDFTALRDLKTKAKLREDYGIKDEWVMPFDVVPIIDVPNYGDQIAPTIVEKMKIASQKDGQNLAKAKEEAYREAFDNGVMKSNCGDFAGMKVKDAKEKIKDDLIQKGVAIPFAEPEKRVVSRSGDVCVVALTDQWFIKYGEAEWKQKIDSHLDDKSSLFKTHNNMTRKELQETVSWLREWGCSRSFGLGTRLPWDEQFLIESLSDSTIYMAYYTIAHMLQESGCLDGSKPNPKYNITPDQMTPEVWDYIFITGTPYPQGCKISEDILKQLRKEFTYWYPVDLRVSGKDLIKNHLTMFLYNHAAIWPDEQATRWPRSIFCNGYIMVDGDKMSKARGNFRTLEQVCQEFSADATRIALADAGDNQDDANFEMSVASTSILRLTTHIDWVKEMIEMKSQGKLRSGEPNLLQDQVFASKINMTIQETLSFYENMQYKNALKSIWFDFENCRNDYRLEVPVMHEELIFRWIEVLTILMAPITPHISEYVWNDLLKHDSSVFKAPLPKVGKIDKTILKINSYLHQTVHSFRQKLEKAKNPTKAHVYVADTYKPWQLEALRVLRELYVERGGDISDSAEISKRLKCEKKEKGLAMGFASMKQQEAKIDGESALDENPPFDEYELITKTQAELVKSALPNLQITFYKTSEPNIPDPQKRLAGTIVGKPQVAFE